MRIWLKISLIWTSTFKGGTKIILSGPNHLGPDQKTTFQYWIFLLQDLFWLTLYSNDSIRRPNLFSTYYSYVLKWPVRWIESLSSSNTDIEWGHTWHVYSFLWYLISHPNSEFPHHSLLVLSGIAQTRMWKDFWSAGQVHARFLKHLDESINVGYFKMLIQIIHKVHIFWEGHNILKNLHLTLTGTTKVNSKVKISQSFVAYSE